MAKTSETNAVPTNTEVAFSAGCGLIFFGLILEGNIPS